MSLLEVRVHKIHPDPEWHRVSQAQMSVPRVRL